MCTIDQAVTEGFFLVGCTQAATEVKDCVVIFQREVTEEFF